jgi:fatty-acyl-CoA synthase
VRSFVADRLARHKVPRDVVFVEEIPRTPTGKIRRLDLPTS